MKSGIFRILSIQMIKRIFLLLKCTRALHAGGKCGIFEHVRLIVRMIAGTPHQQDNRSVSSSCIRFWRKLRVYFFIRMASFIEFGNAIRIFREDERSGVGEMQPRIIHNQPAFFMVE